MGHPGSCLNENHHLILVCGSKNYTIEQKSELPFQTFDWDTCTKFFPITFHGDKLKGLDLFIFIKKRKKVIERDKIQRRTRNSSETQKSKKDINFNKKIKQPSPFLKWIKKTPKKKIMNLCPQRRPQYHLMP